MVKINQMKKTNYLKVSTSLSQQIFVRHGVGKNYLAFVFQDETGTITEIVGCSQPHNVEQFQAGQCRSWAGRREIYNNTPQVTLSWPCGCLKAGAIKSSRFKEKPPVTSRFEGLLIGDDFQNRKSSLATCGAGTVYKYGGWSLYPAPKTNHHVFWDRLSLSATEAAHENEPRLSLVVTVYDP